MPRRAIAALIVGALLVVVAMVAVVGYLNDRTKPDAEPVQADVSIVPEPSPSEWPSSWPVTPSPTPDDLVLGEGRFPDAESVDRTSIEDVALTFSELSTSWDTAFDTSEADAIERARPLMADELTLPPTPERTPGWAEPFEHRAFSIPVVAPHALHGDVPPQALINPVTGEQMTPFAVCAAYSWQGRDDWSQVDAGSRLVHLSLVQREGEWQVIEYGYLAEPC